jgi:hypothetical protein
MKNFAGSAAISSARSSTGHFTPTEPSSSASAAKIFPRARKVGMPQASFSSVSGSARARRRTSCASAMSSTLSRGTDNAADRTGG